MSNEVKRALLDAALPKLEKSMKTGKKKSPKLPPEMVNAPSLSDKGPAKLDYTGYGREMAQDYLTTLGIGATTWQDRILNLVKTASDKDRQKALSAAVVVAKTCKDEVAAQSLKKRITEARRVFKAASVKGHAKVLKLLEGAGSWHQKISKMPKQSNAGRKAKPAATVQEAMASVESSGNASILPGMTGHSKVGVVKLGDVFGMVERLSIPDCLKVLDLCAGKIMVFGKVEQSRERLV